MSAASGRNHGGSPTEQVVVALLTVTISLVLVFGTVLVIHDSITLILRIRALVNINGEANVPAWWNVRC